MLKSLLTFFLLNAALIAQWVPLGSDPYSTQWMASYQQAGYGVYTHRAHTNILTPEQQALAAAIVMVEQGLTNPNQIDPATANKVGDNGRAIGPFQIWDHFFNDARQYDGRLAPSNQCYPHFCGHFPTVGYYPRHIYVRWWWTNNCAVWWCWHMRYGADDMQNIDAGKAERIARRHNGGPQGHKQDSTKKYWEKVKKKLQQHFPGVIPGI